MTTLQAIILAIIEGITEFLPVSSTGHMIIGSSLMGIAEQPLTKTFYSSHSVWCHTFSSDVVLEKIL